MQQIAALGEGGFKTIVNKLYEINEIFAIKLFLILGATSQMAEAAELLVTKNISQIRRSGIFWTCGPEPDEYGVFQFFDLRCEVPKCTSAAEWVWSCPECHGNRLIDEHRQA